MMNKLAFGVLWLAMVGVGMAGTTLLMSSETPTIYAGPALLQPVDLSFHAGSNDTKLLRDGWHAPSRDCTWSSGRASVRLNEIGSGPQGIQIVISADGLIGDRRPQQSVDVLVNGSKLTTLTWAKGQSRRDVASEIPSRLIGARGDIELTFVDRDPKSIRDMGLGDGTAPHAICLAKLYLSPQ